MGDEPVPALGRAKLDRAIDAFLRDGPFRVERGILQEVRDGLGAEGIRHRPAPLALDRACLRRELVRIPEIARPREGGDRLGVPPRRPVRPPEFVVVPRAIRGERRGLLEVADRTPGLPHLPAVQSQLEEEPAVAVRDAQGRHQLALGRLVLSGFPSQPGVGDDPVADGAHDRVAAPLPAPVEGADRLPPPPLVGEKNPLDQMVAGIVG